MDCCTKIEQSPKIKNSQSLNSNGTSKQTKGTATYKIFSNDKYNFSITPDKSKIYLCNNTTFTGILDTFTLTYNTSIKFQKKNKLGPSKIFLEKQYNVYELLDENNSIQGYKLIENQNTSSKNSLECLLYKKGGTENGKVE